MIGLVRAIGRGIDRFWRRWFPPRQAESLEDWNRDATIKAMRESTWGRWR